MKLITKRLNFRDLKISPIKIENFSRCQNPSRENALEIYKQMLKIYQGAWHDRYGPTDEGIWSNVFARATLGEVKRGFEALKKLREDTQSRFYLKPPDAWEFLDICKPAANDKYFDIKEKRKFGWAKSKIERDDSILNNTPL